MGQKSWKILGTVCMVIMVLFFCGCSDKNDKPKGEKNTSVTQGALVFPEPTSTPQSQFDGPVLVWVIPDLINIKNEQVMALNEALDELGCEYHVQFKTVSSDEYAEGLEKIENVDIASAGFFSSNEQSADILKSGFFEALNPLLDGTELYRHYSEKMWDMVRINDVIYTIPSTGGYVSEEYYVFNKKFFTEEQIEGLELSIWGLEELLATIPQEDKFSPLIIGSFLDTLDDLGMYVDNGLVFSESSGIAPLFCSEELLKTCQMMRRYWEKGYLNYAFSATGADSDYPELMEAYEALGGVRAQVLIEGMQYGIYITKDKWSLPAEGTAIIKSHPIMLRNKTNGGMGIAAASKHKAEAFDLLCRFFTDKRLQKILISPKEDITTENAEQLYNERMIEAIVFGTRDLFFPDYQTRNEFYDTFVSKSVYCGFHPDFGVDTAVLSQINKLENVYQYIWALPDCEMWMAKLQEKLSELGVENIAAAVGKQYEEWKKD